METKSRRNKSGTRRVLLQHLGSEYLIFVREKQGITNTSKFHLYDDYTAADCVFDLPLDVLCNSSSNDWLSLVFPKEKKNVSPIEEKTTDESKFYSIADHNNKLALFNSIETFGSDINLLWDTKELAEKMCSMMLQYDRTNGLHVIAVDKNNYEEEALHAVETYAGPGYMICR